VRLGLSSIVWGHLTRPALALPGNLMDDSKRDWQKIISRLDATQQKQLKCFVLNSIRSQRPIPLWLYGPAASGRAALVSAISVALGRVIVINGYDLERGGLALEPLYDYVLRNTIASLLVIKAGRVSRRFLRLLFELGALVSGETVFVRAKDKKPLEWKCDLPICFVADVPPPEGSLLARCVQPILLGAFGPVRQTPARDFTASLGRTVRRWALSA